MVTQQGIAELSKGKCPEQCSAVAQQRQSTEPGSIDPAPTKQRAGIRTASTCLKGIWEVGVAFCLLRSPKTASHVILVEFWESILATKRNFGMESFLFSVEM